MKSFTKNLHWLLAALFIFFLFSLGCVTAGDPGSKTSLKTSLPPYQGPLPEKCNALSEKNPLLAQELRKLPELRDGISEEESTTLVLLADIYINNQESFDRAFEQMYNVGIPERRMYCSPLQAYYWLAQEQQVKGLHKILKSYTLNELLSLSWMPTFKRKYDLPILPDLIIPDRALSFSI